MARMDFKSSKYVKTIVLLKILPAKPGGWSTGKERGLLTAGRGRTLPTKHILMPTKRDLQAQVFRIYLFIS